MEMKRLLANYQSDEFRFIGGNRVEFRVYPKDKRYVKATINEDGSLNVLEDVTNDRINMFDYHTL